MILHNVRRYGEEYFFWRRHIPLVGMIAFSVGLACFTGLCAQFKFWVPWSVVPITLQTFAVLLSGYLLGTWWGGVSQLMYVGGGLAGIPWFAGMQGGMSAFFSPTFGFLVGFVIATFFLGFMLDTFPRLRGGVSLFVCLVLANVLIYVAGLFGLWLLLDSSFTSILGQGLYPFLPGDLLKLVLLFGIIHSTAPQEVGATHAHK